MTSQKHWIVVLIESSSVTVLLIEIDMQIIIQIKQILNNILLSYEI
jgi:hypothetical protein